MRYVLFKLFFLLNLAVCSKLYATSKNNLEYKKGNTYLIKVENNDIQSQLFDQLKSQIENSNVKDSDSEENKETNKESQSDFQNFFSNQGNNLNNDSSGNRSGDLNEIHQDSNSSAIDNINIDDLSKKIDQDIENKNLHRNEDVIPNISENLYNTTNELNSEDKDNKSENKIENTIPTIDSLNKENKDSNVDLKKDSKDQIKIPEIFNLDTTPEKEKIDGNKLEENFGEKEKNDEIPSSKIIRSPFSEDGKKNSDDVKIEDRKMEDDKADEKKRENEKREADLLALLNENQNKVLEQDAQDEIKSRQEEKEKVSESKSFTDKIKDIFGGSKKEEEKKTSAIDNEKKENKEVIEKKPDVDKSESKNEVLKTEEKQAPKKQIIKKTKPILKPEIQDVFDIESERFNSEYEYKVYEYNKRPNNLNNYKVVANVPEFLEKAHDTMGNGHISRIYSQDDYIHTLFRAINDEQIGAIDRIFQILKSGNVSRKDGETPLIYAVKNKKYRSVEYLLMRGADKEVKNGWGESALNVAKRNNDYEMVKILNQS